MVNIILIGMGFHAQKLYLNFFKKYKKYNLLNISLVLDLKTKQKNIEKYLDSNNLKLKTKFIEPFTSEIIPKNIASWLSEFSIKNKIAGVIIATEPRAHYAYAKWALENKLNILMDKPICTFDNVVSDLNQAKKISTYYKYLNHEYQKLQSSKKTVFSINTQRRYHPGFQLIKDKINEIINLTGCPVTNIVSNHSDGQFRLPNELVSMDYHGYNKGYGKISHSGYHIIDLFYFLYKSSLILKTDFLTNLEVFSSFTLLPAFLKQIQKKDYENIFGATHYKKYNPLSNNDIKIYTDRYGELDASINIKVLSENDNLCNVTLNLLHNSFSQRNHLIPAKNLYLNNGRVKHEWHQIQQGPFQNIQVHSYKTGIKSYDKNSENLEINSTTHFDITIYRNKLITKKEDVIQKFNIINLLDYNSSYKFNSIKNTYDAKENVIFEFIHLIKEGSDKRKMLSSITDHKLPCSIMSAIYQSHILYLEKKNPIVYIDL